MKVLFWWAFICASCELLQVPTERRGCWLRCVSAIEPPFVRLLSIAFGLEADGCYRHISLGTRQLHKRSRDWALFDRQRRCLLSLFSSLHLLPEHLLPDIATSVRLPRRF